MTDSFLIDAFARLMADVAGPEHLRPVLDTGDAAPFWQAMAESGFLDALRPETNGGAGLTLAEATPLFMLAGTHLVPAPLAETMVARALLPDAPEGAIALGWTEGEHVTLALGRSASHALVAKGAAVLLAPVPPDASAHPGGDGLTVTIALTDAAPVPLDAAQVHSLAAAVATAQMAGVTRRLLEITVDYANTRQQFGKPIGKQQALQQQLAIMAEKTVATVMAGQMACAAATALRPDPLTVAAAKSVASAAAPDIAAIAHAVHGAIGLSAESDLHLFTKRLHALRAQAGAEALWTERLGLAALTGPERTSVDLLRAITPA